MRLDRIYNFTITLFFFLQGIADESRIDQIPYTTLSYSTGGQNNIAYEVINGTLRRINPRINDTTDFEYSQQAAIITDEAHHGGGDVIVYSTGISVILILLQIYFKIT